MTIKLHRGLPQSTGAIIAFSLAQAEISRSIEALLLLDRTQAVPTPALLRGDHYSLLVGKFLPLQFP